MRATLLVLLAASTLGMAGCASTRAEKPTVCDGKHRRPANPYGSVLPTIPLPSVRPAGTSGGQPPPPAPGPLSRVDARSFQACGRPA